MSERISVKSRILRATSAALVVASCSGSDKPAAQRPNVEAPIISVDLDGHNNQYALAYGMGLNIGCNSDLLLGENNEPKPGTQASKAYELALQKNPVDTLVGFEAGLHRGLAERQIENSAVC